ncbi:MAG TPA: zinc-binding dehydrogenase [Gemmatimonadales bacterium]|nr:zinc-binding dehydrogenase [Gemmatimonadales bacterium]
MRAAVLTDTGGLDRLTVADVPDPGVPGPGQVRVAIRAAALNHLDLFVASGLPGIHYQFPHIVGADGAGVIDAVGPGVTRVKAGDRVMINSGISDRTCEFCRAGEHSLCITYRILGEHLPGTLCSGIVLPEFNVAPIPAVTPALSWPEAAAFSLVTLTAWRMVHTRAQVKQGEWVLVWGIGGGVSLSALRIAKQAGARVIATSSSDAKLARARELGADATLNHATQDIPKEVRALTEKRGVDVVVENVGEATWERSIRVLAKGGRVVTCGGTTGPMLVTDVRRLFWGGYSILGSTMGNDAEYAAIVAELSAGRLRPVVDRVFPLEQVRDAYTYLDQAEQLGKVAVEISA